MSPFFCSKKTTIHKLDTEGVLTDSGCQNMVKGGWGRLKMKSCGFHCNGVLLSFVIATQQLFSKYPKGCESICVCVFVSLFILTACCLIDVCVDVFVCACLATGLLGFDDYRV